MATPTPNYGLKRPDDGTVGWGADVRWNFTTLDTIIKAIEDNTNGAIVSLGLLVPRVASLEATMATVQGQIVALQQQAAIPRGWSLNVEPVRAAAVDLTADYALVSAAENLSTLKLQYPSVTNGVWGLSLMDAPTGSNPPALTVDHNWYAFKPFQAFRHFIRVGKKLIKIGENNASPLTGNLFTDVDISPAINYDPIFASDPSYITLILGLDSNNLTLLDGTFVTVQITKVAIAPDLFRIRMKLCNNGISNIIGYKIVDNMTALAVSTLLEGFWDLSVHQDMTSHFSINGVKQISTLLPAMPSLGTFGGALLLGYEIANLNDTETLYLEYNNLFEMNIGHDPALGA